MRLTLITLISIPLAIAQAPPPAAPPRPARVQPPARITEFRTQPETVQPGQPATLIWATENPNAITISPEIGKVTPRGSRQVNPKATTTYTLTVTGPNNTVVTKEVTVTVPGTTPVNASAAPATEAKKDVPRLANGKPDLSGVYSFGGGGAPGRGAPGGGRGAPGGGRGAAPAGPELKPGMEKYRVVRGPNDAGALSDCMPIAGPGCLHRSVSIPDSANAQLRDYPARISGHFPHRPNQRRYASRRSRSDLAGRFRGPLGRRHAGSRHRRLQHENRTERLSSTAKALHIVERFSRPDFDTLQYDATLEDPNVFVRPWTVSRTFPLRPDLNKIDEFVCENNKDYSKLFVKPQ